MNTQANQANQALHAPQIPIDRWGKDHWSLLAFVETRAVDYKGIVDGSRMRWDPRISPPRAAVNDGRDYPTRLRDGTSVSPHDDWACIEDFVREGLITWEGTGASAVFVFTQLGWTIVHALREHKAAGGTFASFTWPLQAPRPS